MEQKKTITDVDLENDPTYQQMLRTLERTEALEAAKPTVFQFMPEQDPLPPAPQKSVRQSGTKTKASKKQKTSRSSEVQSDAEDEGITTIKFTKKSYRLITKAVLLYSYRRGERISASRFVEEMAMKVLSEEN